MWILHRIMRLLPPPVAKCLALAIPFNMSILLIRFWVGYEGSVLIGLLTSIGAYAATDYFLRTPEERGRRLRSMREGIAALVIEHAGTIILVILCVAVSAATLGNPGTPKEAVVAEVMLDVKLFGFVIGLFYTVARALLFFLNRVALTTFIEQTALFAAEYHLALWLIGHIGDSAYRWALENPQDAAAGLIAAAIVWIILKVSSGWRSAQPEYVARGVAVFPPRELTERDTRYTAAHEAGHALVYAALGRLPADVKVAINDRPDAHGVLGFVTGIHERHRLPEKTFAEWRMLELLAGRMGESTLGETTLGGSNDHLQWLDIACLYLSNHCRGMFYAEPQNRFEWEQREAKLEALHQEQLRTLKSLFDLNAEVFRQLADALLERRTLTRDDLIPFLARVKLPEGFPRPSGSIVEANGRRTSSRDCDGRAEP